MPAKLCSQQHLPLRQMAVSISAMQPERMSKETINCSDKEIIKLCREVGLYDDIMKLPNGFNTYLSPLVQLSAGQKAKLQIIRCILRDRPIMLLDEPLANLDAASKLSILKLIKDYSSSKEPLI